MYRTPWLFNFRLYLLASHYGRWVCSSLSFVCPHKTQSSSHFLTSSNGVLLYFWLGQFLGVRWLWLSMLRRDDSCSKLYDMQCPVQHFHSLELKIIFYLLLSFFPELLIYSTSDSLPNKCLKAARCLRNSISSLFLKKSLPGTSDLTPIRTGHGLHRRHSWHPWPTHHPEDFLCLSLLCWSSSFPYSISSSLI